MDIIHRSPIKTAGDLLKEHSGFVVCERNFNSIESSDDEYIVCTNDGLHQMIKSSKTNDPHLCSECFFLMIEDNDTATKRKGRGSESST